MEKELNEEKRQKENKEFKNDFVKNSMNNEEIQRHKPITGIKERYESEREPNGMDPETIFEKGYSFQESPDEILSQSANRFDKEPNSINPKKR